MGNKTLRALAKDYATGAIDKDKYRKSRLELIKGIIAGEIAVQTIDYPPPLMPSEEDEAITETAKRDRTEIVPPPAPKKAPAKQNNVAQNDNKSPMIFILVSSAIVLGLIVSVYLFYPKPPGTGSSSAATPAPANTTTNVTKTSNVSASMAGETLLADFLSEKNWNEASLDKFIESWSALSEEERESAQQTNRMKRMNDSIYKQFLEAKALASIDNEQSISKQQKLIEFADAIGIIDSRLVLN